MTSPNAPAGQSEYSWPTRSLKASVAIILVALLGLSALAWIATARSGHTSMVSGLIGTGGDMELDMMAEAAGAPLFLGMWVLMMVAMMFPSVSPMVISYWKIARSRKGASSGTAVFVASYLALWSVFGFLAFIAYRLLLDETPALSTKAAALAGGGVLVAAGVYQLSRLKTVCLRHCKTPIEMVFEWKPGIVGALRMGGGHGLYCLGCCWGLMAVLFVLGLMNLAWMGAVSAVIFIEKIAPFGFRMAKGVGIGLVAMGAAVALWPVLF